MFSTGVDGGEADADSVTLDVRYREAERPLDGLVSLIGEVQKERLFITACGLSLFRTWPERGDRLVTSLQPAKIS